MEIIVRGLKLYCQLCNQFPSQSYYGGRHLLRERSRARDQPWIPPGLFPFFLPSCHAAIEPPFVNIRRLRTKHKEKFTGSSSPMAQNFIPQENLHLRRPKSGMGGFTSITVLFAIYSLPCPKPTKNLGDSAIPSLQTSADNNMTTYLLILRLTTAHYLRCSCFY